MKILKNIINVGFYLLVSCDSDFLDFAKLFKKP